MLSKRSVSSSREKLQKKLFLEACFSKESKNLIRIWELMDEAKKKMREEAKRSEKEIKKVGVIGSGVMGSQIALSFAKRGFFTRVIDTSDERLVFARNEVEKALKKDRRRSEVEKKSVKDNLSYSLDLKSLSSMDLVIESVVENKDIKKGIFKDLLSFLSPGALFCSNTSSFLIKELGEDIGNERFFGFHFFNPVSRIPLVELMLDEEF